ncbi:hypothetical protein SAMN04487950_2144 [Halogranum rubrum]|uniref:Uncharacterized protein n=1 Tax=Halogranum rubrum TaxID=553466 RepID=A0A1I4EGV2_9EURY|nr:HTH domain-containing protein [Halogranum rubrum]SFL04459.1 hypothetical protein SAMN04487950_2144 [Halogranum rubrum]
MTQSIGGGTRAELWVNAPGETDYEPLVTHLDQLEATGTVDDYVVYHWGHDLDVSSDRLRCVEDQLARERISAFKQWALEHDCTVTGLGDRVTAGVGRMGPEYTAEHLPPVLLAEYAGDDLELVTPCSTGHEHVVERLQALREREETDAGGETATPSPASSVTTDEAMIDDAATPSLWGRLVRRLR